MSVEQQKALLDKRNKANADARAIVDAALAEGRAWTAEEEAQVRAFDAEYESTHAALEDLRARDARDEEVRAVLAQHPESRTGDKAAVVRDVESDVRALARGEIRSLDIEQRAVSTGSTGSPVPTSFYDQIMELARYTGPMLEVGFVLSTSGGEPIQIPRTNAYSTGSVTAEGNGFASSDPTFQAFLTLGAFKESTRSWRTTEWTCSGTSRRMSVRPSGMSRTSI